MQLPTLDAHGHISPKHPSNDLKGSGAVLAMTLSLDEAELGINRKDVNITWGVGCHPRSPTSQEAFDIKRFESLLKKTAVVGEVGLDTGSRVPLEAQLRNFRQVLKVISAAPRFVSIHSHRATRLVVEELQRTPIEIPVLHGWTGSAEETSQAVELGCYFSIHSAIARQSKFRTRVPPERILVESDNGYNDPPAAIPCRIEWVEYMAAQQFKLEVQQVRELVWRNLAILIHNTGTQGFLPEPMASVLSSLNLQNQQ